MDNTNYGVGFPFVKLIIVPCVGESWWIEMLKCKICGTEFPAVQGRHYIGRDCSISGGINQSVNGKKEETIYDCYDCPQCGSQVVAQERKIKCF